MLPIVPANQTLVYPLAKQNANKIIKIIKLFLPQGLEEKQ